MFLFKNKTLNKLINSFKLWEDGMKKCKENETDAFASLEEWSLESNNAAIQDVSGKLMNLYSKLNTNNNPNIDNSMAINEIVELFKKFKEYDIKLNKLKEKILDIEKLEKKREKELDKCPSNKNIRDYEVRLYQARTEKEKFELEYYKLSNEVEFTKTILFKNYFNKFYNALLKRNKAEEIVLHAMNKLINEIPDVTDVQIKNVIYENYEQTNEIFNSAIYSLNNLIIDNGDDLNSNDKKQARNSLKSRKKLKTRISCPHITSNLYPKLEGIKEFQNSFDTIQSKNVIYKIMPTAPPQSDAENSSQKKI